MKIVAKSNFNIESIADWLVAEKVSELYAAELCKFMNERHSGEDSTYYFHVMPEDYKLWRGMAELV